MSHLDYFFIFIIFLSFIIGCFRGFTRELFSLVGWIFAYYFANYFSDRFLKFIPFEFSEQVNFIIVYVMIFIITLLTASFLSNLLNRFVNTIGLGSLNLILGSIFGCLRGILIAFIIIFLVEKTSFVSEDSLIESKTIPIIKLVIKKTLSYLPYDWTNKVKYDHILS